MKHIPGARGGHAGRVQRAQGRSPFKAQLQRADPVSGAGEKAHCTAEARRGGTSPKPSRRSPQWSDVSTGPSAEFARAYVQYKESMLAGSSGRGTSAVVPHRSAGSSGGPGSRDSVAQPADLRPPQALASPPRASCLSVWTRAPLLPFMSYRLLRSLILPCKPVPMCPGGLLQGGPKSF